MGDSNMLLTILQNLTNYITGPIGKSVLLLAIIIAGVCMISGKIEKSTAFCIIGGAVLIFSASYMTQTILGIS